MPMGDTLRAAVPKPAQHALLEAYTRVQMVVQRGSGVTCPLCESTFRRFTAFGDPPRPYARCPRCRALERHRLAWWFLQGHTDLFDRNLRVLHVAPEPPLARCLRTVAGLDYLTADIDPSRADVQMDIMNIQYPDSFFDVVLCSHVLEHVLDAGTAMRELHRVLAPTGFALLDAPTDPEREHTYEDWSITSDEGRRRAFGQWDHVRLFGRDYPDLLRSAGFHVEVDPYPPNQNDSKEFGLREEDHIYYCTK